MGRFSRLVLMAVLGVMASSTPLFAQATEAGLPDEVREWMERDQLQRWAALIQEGDSIFNNASCSRCHGSAGVDGRNGPNLADAEWVQSDGSLEGIRRTVFWGVRREHMVGENWRFEMNPGGGTDLEWNQYSALAAYVWSLSNGTHLPGR